MNSSSVPNRLLLLALAAAVLTTALLPVTAKAAENSAWIELLQYHTVNDSGNNLVTFSGSGTISIKTPQYMRLTKIDLLLSHTTGFIPSSINVRYNGTLYPLTIQKIDSTTVRAYTDKIPDTLYADVWIQFNCAKTASTTYQLLSVRASSLVTQEFQADAECAVRGTSYPFPSSINVPAVSGESVLTDELLRVDVFDWMKYDTLTIWGSSTNLPLTSIRATLGTKGLPITVSYMEVTPSGYWTEDDRMVSGTYDPDAFVGGTGYYEGEEWSYMNTELDPSGRWLYCVTIDLTEVDRTATTDRLVMYLTGLMAPDTGFTFVAQYVSGSVTVADTTEASWWTRFTTFLSGLFDSDSSEADDFKDDMQQQGQVVEDAAGQIESVTRPALDDVDVNINQFIDADGTQQVGNIMGQLFSSTLVVTMVMISLMVALAAFVIFGKR